VFFCESASYAPTYQLAKHLAGLLGQLTGNSPHHVQDSGQFIQILDTIKLQPGDLMVSFDIVSLFTNVPINDSLKLLSQHFQNDLLALFKHVLTSAYFSFDNEYYEQTDGVAMGSHQSSPTSSWRISKNMPWKRPHTNLHIGTDM
jgi:hypothetical protein